MQAEQQEFRNAVEIPPAPPELECGHHHVHLKVRLLHEEREAEFKLPANAPLSEVLEDGARHLHVELLPPAPIKPLDELRGVHRHDHIGAPITDLDQSLHQYLHYHEGKREFVIELVLAFRVNTRWAVATAHKMTPRQILALPTINLDYQQYTLYLCGSAAPLALDQEITLHRGEVLEAQRDGKYGGQL